MNDRFKKHLTPQVITADYNSAVNNLRGDPVLPYIGMVFASLVMPLLIPFFVHLHRKREKLRRRTPFFAKLNKNQLIIREDTCIEKYTSSDESSTSYYLVFAKRGRKLTNENGPASGTCCPGYNSVSIGEKFYVVSIRNVDTITLFYSQNEWRNFPMTEEMIAREIREEEYQLRQQMQQEEDFLQNAMALEPSPNLVARTEYFSGTDPKLFLVPDSKDLSSCNLIEKMAALRFSRDLLPALEYVLRYCPEEAQKTFSSGYSAQQQNLSQIIAAYIRDDVKKQKRKNRKNSIKSFFHKE